MRQSSASTCVGAPRCPTASRSSQSSPPHVSGVRNSSGLPTRRWPKRPVPLLRRSRPSAGARRLASRKRTRPRPSHLHRAVQHPAALGCELCRGDRQSGRDGSDRGNRGHRLLHLDWQHPERVPGRAPRRGHPALPRIAVGLGNDSGPMVRRPPGTHRRASRRESTTAADRIDDAAGKAPKRPARPGHRCDRTGVGLYHHHPN